MASGDAWPVMYGGDDISFIGFFDTKVRVWARSGLQLFQKGHGLKSLNLLPVYALS